MILNNFTKLLYGCLHYQYRAGGFQFIDITGKKVDVDNNSSSSMISEFVFSIANFTNPYSVPFCLAVGTDDTPVTAEDCEWSHDIDTLSNGGYSLTLGEGVHPRVVRTYINNTDSDITINEIALIARLRNAKIMLIREVLTQPLTIKPGGIQAVGLDIGG